MKRASLLLAVLLTIPCATASADPAALHDVEELLRIAPTRNMGSPHREAIDRYLAERFRSTGFELGCITFPTAAYVPGRAEMRLPDGTTLPLYDMAPNYANPGNLLYRRTRWLSFGLMSLLSGTVLGVYWSLDRFLNVPHDDPLKGEKNPP